MLKAFAKVPKYFEEFVEDFDNIDESLANTDSYFKNNNGTCD